MIAIITWFSIKMGWTNIRKPTIIIPCIIFGLIYPIYTTIITITLFGGGPLWKPIPAAIYSATLASTGNFWLANYVQQVSTEIPDKIISYIVALIIAGRIPEKFKIVRR
ncbi:MAG: hypothetical protein ABDH32_07185 [Candidatus Caldarchaeales archaeon]